MKGWLAMKIRNLDEITATAGVEKNKIKNGSKETYGLEFVPSKETLDSIKDAIVMSKTSDGAYDTFEDLWKDLMSDED